MFNFIKKGVSSNGGGGSGGGGERDKTERDEKDKRKREKKLRKESKSVLSGSMSTEELLRLDEVRRSLKIRGRRKEKEKLPSGITADYSAEFFAAMRSAESADCNNTSGSELDRGNEEIVETITTRIEGHYNGASGGGSDSYTTTTENSKKRYLPPVPPKPPKRGILKGSRSNIVDIHEEISFPLPQNLNDKSSKNGLLLRKNEQVFSENIHSNQQQQQQGATFTSVESLRSDRESNGGGGGGGGNMQRAMTLPVSSRYSTSLQSRPNAHGGNLNVMTSPSPSADSLTDTTNSPFATPPFSLSPIGESQGIDRWGRVHVFENVELPLPPIRLIRLPPPRKLIIHRQKSPRQDFGFSLRKALCLDRSESLHSPTLKPVIFAEPGAGGGATGLLPGDRLLKVNDIPVQESTREEIIEMIRNSGDSVAVEVQPVSELVELSRRCIPQGDTMMIDDDAIMKGNCNTLKRSASKRFKQSRGNIKNYENGHDDDGLYTGNRDDLVWLIHRGGFCAAAKLPQSKALAVCDQHKAIVQLLHNGEELTVDEDDIEKQNPTELDLIEDICELKHLNEASVLHCLRQRFASNLIHTKAGPTLIVLNPMANLALYSEKVVSMFRGCKTEDMPPHIYSLAQSAYRSMLESRRDQSLIFLGRSGSGKTTSFKHALYYLILAAGSANNYLSAEKINSLNVILESFGNTKTSLNSNATRMTQLLSLDFDTTGQIASASVQILLPERQRAGRRLKHEYSFYMLTRLIAGAEGLLQKELLIDNIATDDSHPFISLPQNIEEGHRASAEFARIVQAFDVLNIDQKLVRGVWNILAAIYHLGIAGVSRVGSGPTTRVQFANPSSARKAATLLGISMEDLTAGTFNITSSSNYGGSTSPLKTPGDSSVESAWECLDALVIGLYSEALAAVVALINKAICTSAHTIASIMLIDTPGFQNPASCGVHSGASISDLHHNYLQERLQLLFYHTTLVAPRDRYAQELIEIDTTEMPESSPALLVSLIDKSPQNHVVRSSQRDLRDQDRRGMLWLLDEESIYPNANDETFLERLFAHFGDREHHMVLRKGTAPRHIVLQHMQGTNPVLYNVDGWVRHSREHPVVRNAASLLQESNRDEIRRLGIGSLTRSAGNIVFCGSIAGLDTGTQSLRRVSSIRRSFTSAGVKRNSIMLQVKFTVDGIIDTLRRTGMHFVHCFMLRHDAGQNKSFSLNGSPNIAANLRNANEDIINVPLLRSQLRGSQILPAARLHRLGFPNTVPLTEFVRRFGLLAESDALAVKKTITAEQILIANEVDTASYRIGPSQIFFRSGILSELEAKRDELLSGRIIQLQAHCRSYLARKHMAQRRVQELAVRCIQRNVKAFLAVRDWPWWRLLVRVMPLLNVHRTEEQLKMSNEELITLRTKLEKIENERNALKADNQKLEAKLSEMTVDLAEERSTANMATERLEAETAERLKLEKELSEQQSKVKGLHETTEKLEMELICAKSGLNGIAADDEELENEEGGFGGAGGDNSSVYKLKYERVARELEFTKRRLQTQHEHDLEQLIGLKKQLEKKLNDAYEEVEEQRQVVGQWKRKAQKMTNEMNDLRMLLEEQNSRNNILEKKQRKFDAESQSLLDTVRQERQAKERLSREKDVFMAEKFTLEQSLADTRLELELKEEKLISVQRELEEMTFSGGTEEEIAQLRRTKNELERRLKEQEEELDEMAGQIQLLEQAKLRLEMALETMRKEARREAQQRDEELEEARGTAYKRIKALECQLESEHEERSLLVREKHELERRLANMEDIDHSNRQKEEAANQKIRRDLRKYKALLKDAHAQLERAKTETPNKTLIRQLRNQLEDAEAARSSAMKARQTVEAELAEIQAMFEESQRGRNDAEDRANAAHRDRAELQAQIEENEEELAELMKKYSGVVKQLNTEKITVSEYEFKMSDLEAERNNLKAQVAELQQRLENIENMADPSTTMISKRLELRTKELESRLELEQATRGRLEVQITRLKEALEKLQNELSQAKARELLAQESCKKAQKSLREMREEFHIVSGREQESVTKRKDLEKKIEHIEGEAAALRNDLRLALQRIADLQQAMEEGDDDDLSEADDSESTDGSLSDDQLRALRLQRSNLHLDTNAAASSVQTTKTLVREKDDNSPRVIVTSPTAINIPRGASAAAKKVDKTKLTPPPTPPHLC